MEQSLQFTDRNEGEGSIDFLLFFPRNWKLYLCMPTQSTAEWCHLRLARLDESGGRFMNSIIVAVESVLLCGLWRA